MKKTIYSIFLLALSSPALAEQIDFSKTFQNKNGCFIVFDINKNRNITSYNEQRCNERITPASTFKVPLSLMAFDQKIINQNTVFKWDGRDKGLPQWNQDQNPKSWLQNSVVWVSQGLTPQIGLPKIKNYLQKFNYGNEDFSGDPGKNNGITQAWLGSSLKISANEQSEFLKNLVLDKLPVSKDALNQTKQNMFQEQTSHGWKLYGKTGTSDKDAWFIGFAQKKNERYIFVLNFSDKMPSNSSEAGGTRAKNLAKNLLTKMGLL